MNPNVKKWSKRIFRSMLVMILLLAVVVFVYYKRAKQVPQWYQQAQTIKADESQSNKIENTRILPMQNWISKNSSEKLDTKTESERQHTIDLTGNDINVLIAKWGQSAGIQEQLNGVVSDIRVLIADGTITIAGRLVEQDMIMSFIVRPIVGDDGRVELKIDSIKLGDATIPLVALNKQKTGLSKQFMESAREDREKIAVDATCVSTNSTAGVYSSLLASKLFAGQSYPWYLFLKKDYAARFPTVMRVKSAAINDDKLTLTLELLGANQRKTFVDSMKDELK